MRIKTVLQPTALENPTFPWEIASRRLTSNANY
jgi:hypothetical protein